jgi:hypothetical protein
MSNIEKSEDQKDNSLDLFERLERVTGDDYFKEVNARADVIESFLNCGPSTAEERKAFVKELDESWIYMQQEVSAWGRIYAPAKMVSPEVYEYKSAIVNGGLLTSAGFMIIPFAAVFDDESIVQYKVAYRFDVDNIPVAMLRDGFVGKFPDSTPEMARHRLEYHYPVETARVVELASDSANLPSATPIMNFTDYEVDFLTYSIDHDNYITDMQTYLFELMNFDRQLPYVVKCELDEFDDGTDPSIIQVVASPVRMRLIPTEDDRAGSPRRHAPWIDLIVHDANRHNPDTKLTVPLRGLKRFESVRHAADGL